MRGNSFQFKQFTIQQDQCAMKVTTDGCLFGAWVADYLRVHPVTGKALDVGTGTGLLSLMVSQKTTLIFDAIEIDLPAAEQAAKNVTGSPFSERIRIVNADVTKPGNLPDERYPVIVSNPPFYENDLVSPDNRRSNAHHDSTLRLNELLDLLLQKLAPGGHFFLLLPAKRWEELKMRVEEYGLTISSVMRVCQTPRHSPFRIMVRGKHKTEAIGAMQDEEIRIREADGNYSDVFTFLLKDYYLYL